MSEIWKKITGTCYSVSNQGNVGNDKTKCLLRPWLSSRGYLCVSFWVDGKHINRSIHRLVAEAFIPNPDNMSRTLQTSFKSGKENPKTMLGKFNELSPVSRPVCQMTKEGAAVMDYPCAREAWRQTGIDAGSITRCCLGKRQTAGGYKWAYRKEDSNETI